jgi:AraC-like DNA-binding protein
MPVPDISYFLEANFTRKLTVQQLADATGKSVSAFKRDFGRVYEMAPLQWVINRRLEYAFFLIRYTNYSIATIAQLSGFGDRAYFAAAYKGKFGISPLQSKLKGVC